MKHILLHTSRLLSLRLACSLCLVVCSSPTALADYIHQTQAVREGTILELHVGEREIEALLEIDADDRQLFQGLLKEGATAPVNSFALLDATSGTPLKGTVQEVESRRRTIRYDPNAPVPVDLRGVPLFLPEVSPLVTFVRLSYPLGSRPTGVILRPPMEKNQERAATNIGFIAFHENLPITNYWYLAQPETLDLNWRDPWRSRFRNPNLRRAHASSLTSYVTVEPFEVRHEVVVRLLDLAPLLGIELTGDQVLEGAQLDRMATRTREFFAARPRTIIDGLPRQGDVTDMNFLSVDAKGVFQLKPRSSEHKAFSTLLGVSLSFPTEGMARKVEVSWDLFSDLIPSITAQVTDPAGPFPSVLTADSPTLVWRNVLREEHVASIDPVRTGSGWAGPMALAALGVLAVTFLLVLANRQGKLILRCPGGPKGLLIGGSSLCLLLFALALRETPLAGGGWLLDDARASALIEQLLANVYRSMEFRQEDRVYDRLALSLQRDLLSDVYLQQRRSLASREDGGAVTRIGSVSVESIRRLGWPAWSSPPTYRVEWTASGTVSHWGHTHQRSNRYLASLALTPTGDVWKIGDLRILDEGRLQ